MEHHLDTDDSKLSPRWLACAALAYAPLAAVLLYFLVGDVQELWARLQEFVRT